MRPILADRDVGGSRLLVNWARMTPYSSSGAYLSRVLDGGSQTAWGTVSWTAETPADTGVTLSVRSGNTATPDGAWTGFTPITNGVSINANARYLQYRAELSTANAERTPVLKDICISYTDTPLQPLSAAPQHLGRPMFR